MLLFLSGLQQQSPIPCQSTMGVGACRDPTTPEDTVEQVRRPANNTTAHITPAILELKLRSTGTWGAPAADMREPYSTLLVGL